MNNILLIVAGLLIIGILIHTYNMGWDAGHFTSHDDDKPKEKKE